MTTPDHAGPSTLRAPSRCGLLRAMAALPVSVLVLGELPALLGTAAAAAPYDTFATRPAPTALPVVSGTARHFTVIKETVSGGVSLPTGVTRSLRSVNSSGSTARTARTCSVRTARSLP